MESFVSSPFSDGKLSVVYHCCRSFCKPSLRLRNLSYSQFINFFIMNSLRHIQMISLNLLKWLYDFSSLCECGKL